LNVTVSPNPATTKVLFDIDLESSEFLSIEIYKVDGQLVDVIAKQSFSTGNTQLVYDVSELSSGLYMYRVTNGENSYTERFTVVD